MPDAYPMSELLWIVVVTLTALAAGVRVARWLRGRR